MVDSQQRTGENEEPTPGYMLLNAGLSKKIYFTDHTLSAGLKIQNVLDRTYVDHMSILRPFEVGSPGRNVNINLQYDF